MASVDPAFRNAGKKPGLEIFRIEKLKVVQITDQDKVGKFHSGDSYIVLSTEKNNNALKWDIHFWLGKETTQDEAGVAAYKTVELDDHLGGAPVQHREVEGHESQAFLNLFKHVGGVKYLPGGVDSGFRKVERDVFEKRLLHVKGKRNVRVSQVELSYKSLNKGDVFILDAGLKLFQWNGAKASRAERAKGLEAIRQIKDQERGGRAQVVIIEDGKDDATEFFKELGSQGPIAEGADDDDQFEASRNAAVKLYRVSDASGSLTIQEAGTAPLKKDMLDSNDAFILDAAGQLFVWIGKKATKEEKNGAWNLAQKFITEKGYPVWTPVTRVTEGAETTVFIQQFASWPSPQSSPNYVAAASRVAKVPKGATNVDLTKLTSAQQREQQKMVDDGSGKLEIWRVEDFKLVDWPKDQYGRFFQGDSYVMLYSYKDTTNKDAWIIYFWQGNDSSQDEKGASALLAKELDDKYGGAPVQVRVVQNKEPDHLLNLFKGKFMILQGGKDSGFKNAAPSSTSSGSDSGNRMFQVHGTNALNTKAVQIQLGAAQLNSNDCFIVETPKTVFAWYGKYATGDERAVTKKLAETLVKPDRVEAVPEGSEKADFWEALGGKAEYHTAKAEAKPDFIPRLFQCSNAGGHFTVEEIFDFAQEDLIEDDIMLLDTYDQVFLWIGQGSNADEKKAAYETAINFLKNATDGRTVDSTPILIVKQGFEPPMFTSHFVGWDAEKAKAGVNDYERLKAELSASSGVSTAQDELKKFSATYPYSRLLERPLPEGVDPTALESHLEDGEFEKVFGMSKTDFFKVPKWKRDNLKREKKLF